MSAGDPLLQLSIREIAAGFRRGEWSPIDVTEAALRRIAATDPDVHAWAEVAEASARESAAAAARELNSGVDRGPLHGMPLGIKDIFGVAGMPTRCGSRALAAAPPARQDAAPIATLRAAGAVVIGKTVTQEFAAGVISPPARNPWDPDRIPGGSSGGSAAAVMLGHCVGAMGSDTGGSIRIPAAACGAVGFKPTFGQIDHEGVYPLSWSLDTVGPIARTVDDAWLMWQILSGVNAPDDAPAASGADNLRGVRIGVARGFFFDGVQPGVLASVDAAIESLRELGATVIDAPWDNAAAARAAAFIINRVETAAVHDEYARNEPERFALYGDDLRLRIAAGRAIPATLYLRALRARAAIRDSMSRLFATHELGALLAPTLPTTAVLADELTLTGTGRDESIGAGWTRLTMPYNATGQPVLSLPSGFDQKGLPVGVQLAGAPGNERMLFRIGGALESALGLDLVPPLAMTPRMEATR